MPTSWTSKSLVLLTTKKRHQKPFGNVFGYQEKVHWRILPINYIEKSSMKILLLILFECQNKVISTFFVHQLYFFKNVKKTLFLMFFACQENLILFVNIHLHWRFLNVKIYTFVDFFLLVNYASLKKNRKKCGSLGPHM